MNRVAQFTIVLVLMLAGPRSASASSIIYFFDYSAFTDNGGSDKMGEAIAASGHAYTEADSYEDFANHVNTGNFDLAIFFGQEDQFPDAYAGAFAALQGQLADGRRAIAADWSRTAGYGAIFNTEFTGNNNQTTMSMTSAELTTGLVNPITLSNPGNAWDFISMGLHALPGGECGGTFANSDCAVVFGNGGRSIFNGFLNDPFFGENAAKGVQLFTNEINELLPQPVPEPTSMVLLGTGLVGVVARRYRRRQS